MAPIQKPVQAPTQKFAAAHAQAPVQKGAVQAPIKTAYAGRFNRFR
jgi:hypothetical protein